MIGGFRETPLRVVLRRAFLTVYVLTIAVGFTGVASVAVVTHRLDVLVSDLQPLSARNSDILQALTNAETGVRGYQLTHKASFLEPYRQGLADYPAALSGAEKLAAGKTDLQRLLAAESAAAGQWLADFAEPVAAGRSLPAGAATPGAGKALFDRVRSANAAVDAYVDKRIAATRAASDSDRRNALVALVTMVVATIAAGTQVGLRVLRGLAPPLERAAGALLRMATGDRSVRLPEDGTIEMAALAGAVNVLAQESERRAVADRRRVRMRNLSADVGRRLRRHLDLDVVLTEAVRTLATAFDVDRVMVRLAEDGAVTRVAAEWDAPHVPPVDRASTTPPALAAAYERLARADSPVLVVNRATEVVADRDFAEYLEEIGAVGAAICPLVADGELVGGLGLLDTEEGLDWDEDELAALETVASDLARAIIHARLYARQQELVAELEVLDEAKSLFVSNVSHELRTPLTSICGYLEMVIDGSAGEIPPAARRMLDIVDRNAGRLRNLIEDLLTLSRIESGRIDLDMQPVEIDKMAAGATAVIGPQAGAGGLEVVVDTAAPGVVILADPAQFERVLLNLLSNAVKFTPAGGRVTVSTAEVGDSVTVSVADTGIGIPDTDKAHIGDRFFRASNATAGAIPGTGLGLSIVRAIVEEHGGTMALTSEAGVGTTVEIRLPRADPDPVAASSGGAAQTP